LFLLCSLVSARFPIKLEQLSSIWAIIKAQPEVIHRQAYRKAFDLVLRRGTPIALSLKAALPEHPATQYIWRIPLC
jgi:hypothetical protein